MLHT
jgi:hypothetical protein